MSYLLPEGVVLFAQVQVLCLQDGKLMISFVFGVHEVVVGLLDGADQFIKLQVHGQGIAVLRVLDQEDHYCRGGIFRKPRPVDYPGNDPLMSQRIVVATSPGQAHGDLAVAEAFSRSDGIERSPCTPECGEVATMATFESDFPNLANAELAAKYDLSLSAVNKKARQLGLTKSAEYRSAVQRKNATGRAMSPESRAKISSKLKGRVQSSAELEQRSTTRNAVKGVAHYNWKGGKPWKRFRNPLYLAWRTAVLERDKYTCQDCGRVCNKREKGLAAHHIKPYARHNELRYEVNNGLTLCRDCHMALHGKSPKAEMAPCACGCGTMIRNKDRYGRPRAYVNHHASRGKAKPESMKVTLSEQRRGKPLSPEHRAKIAEGLRNSTKRVGRPPRHRRHNQLP